MKSYILYMIKTKWLQTLIIALVTAFILLTIFTAFRSEIDPNIGSSRYPAVFGIAGILLFIDAVIVAIFRFAPLRNQKEVDLYYGLPISRKKLYATHYLLGVLQLLVIACIVYFLGIISFSMLSLGAYGEGFMILLLPVTSFYVILVYTLWSFIFIKANTMVDGIIFIILLNVLLLFISLFIMRIYQYQAVDRLAFVVSPYYGHTIFSRLLLSAATPNHFEPLETFDYIFLPLNTFFYVLLAFFALFQGQKTISKEKIEHIGDLSSSRLGYLSMIPLIIFFGVVGTSFSGTISIFFKAMFFIAGFIGLFVYRRGIKISYHDSLRVIIPWILGIIVLWII